MDAEGKAPFFRQLQADGAFKIAYHTLETDTHIFFYQGPFSNHFTTGTSFTGAEAFPSMILEFQAEQSKSPEVATLKWPDPNNMISSRLLANPCFSFNCAEQFMMAVKAWLFEDEEDMWSCGDMTEAETKALLRDLLCPEMSPEVMKDKNKSSMYRSSLCEILRHDDPRKQKQLGRDVANFNDGVWNLVRKQVVTSAIVARAKAWEPLRTALLQSGDRVFVEGAPRDKIWGVGIAWDKPAIRNPKNWSRGGNLLGQCYGKAREILRQEMG